MLFPLAFHVERANFETWTGRAAPARLETEKMQNDLKSYFHADAYAINAACARNPNAIVGAGLLTLLSIRQPFHRVKADFATVQREGVDARPLFGWKRAGFQFLLDNKESLYDAANRARGKDDSDSLETLILSFLAAPGLGLAKASFLAQLTTGRGACLDSHNLERLGLNEAAFKLPKKLLPRSILAKLRAYNEAWQSQGDSAFWWNTWCDHVAAKYPTRFVSGAEVSRVHLVALEWSPNE